MSRRTSGLIRAGSASDRPGTPRLCLGLGKMSHFRSSDDSSYLRPNDKGSRKGKPRTFDLLGFTHYWGRSRRGLWVVKRKTSSSRMDRSLRAIAAWCRRNMHRPLCEQQQALSQKLRGHCAYYGITGNSSSLSSYRTQVHRIWRYWSQTKA